MAARTPINLDIFDFSSEIKQHLTEKQDPNVLYQVCVFPADRKKKMTDRLLIGWDIFDFFSETAERNSTKLNRRLDLN